MAEAVIVLDPAFVVGKTDPVSSAVSLSISDDVSTEGYSSRGTRQPMMRDFGKMYWNWFANLGSP
jgi:hypothetical protein